MADFGLKQPPQFDFKKKASWLVWIKRFDRYRLASGLSEKEGDKQVSALIYAMGPDADEILSQFQLSDDDEKNYAAVKKSFDEYFSATRNVLYEVCKFRKRRQGERESVEAYVTSLYTLSDTCEFGERRDREILLQLIIGVRDDRLSQKLQLDPKVSLEKAITIARQYEEITEQQTMVRSQPTAATTPTSSLEPITRGSKPKPTFTPRQPVNPKKQQPAAAKSQQQKPAGCQRCGYAKEHPRAECRATDAKCTKCGKIGHYARVCRSAAVSELSSKPVQAFLGALDTETTPPWEVEVRVNDTPLSLKIDTGADVTAIPESLHEHLGSPALTSTPLQIFAAGGKRLTEVGAFTAKMSVREHEAIQSIYVVRPLRHALLGRPAIEALQILKRPALLEREEKEAIIHEIRIREQFPALFRGLGTMPGEYVIRLRDGAKPFALTTPRRVALPLIDSVKAELERMQSIGVISPVDEPTEWCAGMVVVPKSISKVRICVDLGKLNECVKRERLMLPAVDHTLGQLRGAVVFSKLDANSGFWQILLAKESSLLTTFITPFGRFCYNRLPFGITSAPEYFQKQMQQILAGLIGVICLMDDCLVYGLSQAEHDDRLVRVCQRLVEAGVTLNPEKCVFSVDSVTFLGHVIDASGIRSDPAKVKAIVEMPAPENVSDVRRFLGMVNHLRKFIPNLAQLTEPLRSLLSKRSHWAWSDAQVTAFKRIKDVLVSESVLAHYDPQAETVVSADASSFGIGAVILQRQTSGDLKPIAYASHSMDATQQRYAQIEKEAFALTWACKRFHDYLYGLPFEIHTDHKPLVPLLSPDKRLDELPLRVQRFRIALARYHFTICHIPGSRMYLPDTLSRAPLSNSDCAAAELTVEADAYLDVFLADLPATPGKLEEIKNAQTADPDCRLIATFAREGWPAQNTLQGEAKKYYSFAGEITVQNGLLLRGSRIIVPATLRHEILEKIHTGHLGIVKCRARAQESVWWPGLAEEIKSLVENCDVCKLERPNPVEPMIATESPAYPWHTVGTDLFEYSGSQYLLVVDYLSRYPEIAKLEATTSSSVIEHLKSIFGRNGIPKVLRSDNGPQFASGAFKEFAEKYDFSHVTSSPRYPQSNGAAERMVKTVKELLKKSDDPYLALLAYRTSPLANGYSPAQILMGRRLRTTVPTAEENLIPQSIATEKLREKDDDVHAKQKAGFDRRHRVKEMPTLETGQNVFIPDCQEYGQVVSQAHTPRSYFVATPGGTIRRNRRKLIPVTNRADVDPYYLDIDSNEEDEEADPEEVEEDTPPVQQEQPEEPNQAQVQDPPVQPAVPRVITRSGRVSKPPDRYDC